MIGASSALYGAGAFNGILFMNSKSPFDFEGISGYYKQGMTSQEAAGDNEYKDFAFRACSQIQQQVCCISFKKVRRERFWIKLKGTDWMAK